jgi:hypothetical protein
MNQIKGLVIKKKQEVKKATRQSRLDTNNNNKQPWLLKTNQATHTRAQASNRTQHIKTKKNRTANR